MDMDCLFGSNKRGRLRLGQHRRGSRRDMHGRSRLQEQFVHRRDLPRKYAKIERRFVHGRSRMRIAKLRSGDLFEENRASSQRRIVFVRLGMRQRQLHRRDLRRTIGCPQKERRSVRNKRRMRKLFVRIGRLQTGLGQQSRRRLLGFGRLRRQERMRRRRLQEYEICKRRQMRDE